MRAALAALILAGSAAAQTRVEAAATAGLHLVAKPTRFLGDAALRVDASRDFDRFTVFASLAGTFNQSLSLADLGSHLGVSARLLDDLHLIVEVFPFTSIRVRDTFDFANLVGLPLLKGVVSPVARAALRSELFDVWVSLGGYTVLDQTTQDVAVAWSGRLGLAARHSSGFSVEARATAHDRGTVPTLAVQGISQKIFSYVVSGRAAWTYGGGVSQQVDLFTYAADPERFERFFQPEPYESHLAAWVGLEGGVASQNLVNTMMAFETKRYTTGYGDLQARLRVGHLRLFLIGRVQPVEFIQFDAPGYPPYSILESAFSRPRIGAWAGTDWRFDRANLELGAQLRLVSPAVTSCAAALSVCQQNIVVHGPGALSILPAGKNAEPVFGATLTARYSPARPLVLVTALDYERNGSATYFTDMGQLVSVVSEVVQVKLLAQAKF